MTRDAAPQASDRRGPNAKQEILPTVKERPGRVLFFFSLGFDVPSPSLHLMEAMVEDSLRAGWRVHIIAAHTEGTYPDIPEHLRSSARLTWDIVSQPSVTKSAFVRRYLSGMTYALRCTPRLWNADSDLVYIQSSPTALYNILVAKATCRGKPIIYSIQDMFPGSSIHSGVMTRRWMQRIFFRLQKLAYASANHITVISEDMKQRVIEQGVADNKVSVIVNWFDDSALHEIAWEQNRFVESQGLSRDTFYVQYAGTMGYVFDYEMVLRVAQILKPHQDIEFQMIGAGSQKAEFEQRARESGLDNIRFYPLQPQEMVGDVYSAASVCLIPLKRGVIGNSVPSKMALIMACNRVVINSVDEDSQYARMFEENEIGLSISNTDPSEVAKAIVRLRTDDRLRIRLAQNALAFSSTVYARSVNTAKLLCLFGQISGERSE